MQKWRERAAWLVFILLAGFAVASLLPLIETDAWFIRYLDFPRLQFSLALIALLILFFLLRKRRGVSGALVILLALAALGYNGFKLWRYAPIMGEAAVEVAQCDPSDRLRVMIANVKKRNEHAQRFLDVVAGADPDLLLVMETDAWWDEHLRPLDASYPHKLQEIPEDHAFFGMHVYSKLPLVSPDFRYLFGAFTPTIFTGVELPDGMTARFIGLHPQPPQAYSQPTTFRDAYLIYAAIQARGSDAPTILAGDFNAVPWEEVSRRAIRIGHLLDPRVGRGLYSSFGAETPIIAWPLDQILFQPGFALVGFEKLPAIDSDHYPMMATLCAAPGAQEAQAAPDLRQGDLEQARATLEAARERAPGGSEAATTAAR